MVAWTGVLEEADPEAETEAVTGATFVFWTGAATGKRACEGDEAAEARAGDACRGVGDDRSKVSGGV